MKSKRIGMLILVCILLAVLLVSCGTDGEKHLTVTIVLEDSTDYIYIADSSPRNHIYVDYQNRQIYCENGQVIRIPYETTVEYREGASVQMTVEVVCELGQDKFDEFLGLFKIVSAQEQP